MSDPTPEDLYEALRKRLADYGQEPPAELWAGIRQQLPPPVAVPRRRRWRAGLVLLTLLFVVASLATWQWQRAGSRAGQPGTVAQQTGGQHSTNNNQPTARLSAPSSAGAGPGAAAPPEATGSTSASAEIASTAATRQANPASDQSPNELAANVSMAKNTQAEALKTGAAANPAMPAVAMATPATNRARRRQRALALARPEADRPAARPRRGAARGPRFGQTTAGQALPADEPAVDAARAFRTAGATRRAPASSNPAFSAATTDVGAGAPASLAASSAARAAADASGRPVATLPGGSKPESGRAVVRPDAEPTGVAQSGVGDWLALRVPGLQVPAGAPLPAPQPVAVAPVPPVLPAVVARWAVQLVAGPGPTYRHLGTPSGLAYATNSLSTPTASPIFPGTNTNRIQTVTPSSAAELERPALGYGAQLSLRRALAPHWTVSAGLGYAEYATSLALRQVSAAQITRANYDFAFLDSLSRTSGTTIRQRDTYRFLTVPLRAGYVWNPGRRWQVGLLGGIDAAVYLGGTSTEGSACACQPRTWGASGSPYRALSLGASLGAEVRYRLAGPWQLLAQPTGSYLLTPLAQPVSGYSIRHLLGGTALLGMSYDLP